MHILSGGPPRIFVTRMYDSIAVVLLLYEKRKYLPSNTIRGAATIAKMYIANKAESELRT